MKINRGLGFAFLVLIAVLLYGSHISDGFLSDDYLYISWASESVGKLLAKVTSESYPRMIRPVAALPWAMAKGAHAAAILHALSILLHATNAFLIALIIRKRTGQELQPYLWASLYLVFPLFAEPVVWLSASFDLWATVFSLAAIYFWQSDCSAKLRIVFGSSAFAFALLSKESIVLLPLILLILLPKERARTAFLFTASLVAAYFLSRFVIFHGLGGYEDSTGRTLAASFNLKEFLRAVCLQLPYRVLAPMKRSGSFALLFVSISGAIVVLLALTIGIKNKIKQSGLALVAFMLALLPAAPIFHIEADHEGTRLLYFPIAILVVMLGIAELRIKRIGNAISVVLIIFWAMISVINGRSWSKASIQRDYALNAMRSSQERFNSNSTVMVDSYDTFHGAYVFRNGLKQAAEYTGLRSDIDWRRGTVAQLGTVDAKQLGDTIYEIGYSKQGKLIDWTACQREARINDLPVIMSAQFKDIAGAQDPVITIVSPWLNAAALPQQMFLSFEVAQCNLMQYEGTVYWRNAKQDKFTVTDERKFKIDNAGERSCLIRLPSMEDNAKEVQFRFDFNTAISSDCIEKVLLLKAECR